MTESWRTVAYSQLASALMLGLATAIAPESPYWLVERGRWVPCARFSKPPLEPVLLVGAILLVALSYDNLWTGRRMQKGAC